MRQFLLGIIVGTVLTTMGVHAAGKEGRGTSDPRRQLNEVREQQFQLDLENMRKQTELEQARMRGRKKPC